MGEEPLILPPRLFTVGRLAGGAKARGGLRLQDGRQAVREEGQGRGRRGEEARSERARQGGRAGAFGSEKDKDRRTGHGAAEDRAVPRAQEERAGFGVGGRR